MRVDLAKYINRYVLCKGWITDWKQEDDNTLRAYIEKPSIKKPNKEKVFDDLELISIEHHINLFLPFQNDDKTKVPYERYQCVTFAGYIKQYTRKDGTTDYGVYPIAQSTLHQELLEMDKYVTAVTEEFKTTSVEALIHLEKNVKPYILHLEEELIDAGDLLPTFYHNYDFYQNEIAQWKDIITKLCKLIRTIHSNRRLRRQYKVKENLAIYVPEFNFDEVVAKMRKPSNAKHKKALKKAGSKVDIV